MNNINHFFLSQGNVIRLHVDAFLSIEISEVLNYAYRLESVEAYVESEKQIIRDKILNLFKIHKKLVFAETDMDFELTSDFFEFTLEFNGDLSKFKRHLKVATAKQLTFYKEILFEKDLFLEKNRER